MDGTATGNTSMWSEDELAVIAMLTNGGSFPTVNPQLITGMATETGDAVIGTVIRSLHARSLLTMTDEGVRPTGLAAEVATIALDPTTVVTIESAGGATYGSTWVGLRARQMCRIDIGTGGTRTIRIDDSDHLVDAICEFAGLSDTTTEPLTESHEVAEISFEDLMVATSPVKLVQAQAVWITDGILHGAVTAFLVLDGHGRLAREVTRVTDGQPIDLAGDMGLSGPDPSPTRSWTLHESGLDAIRTSLADLLPDPLT